jgi:hypothetical protein
MYLQRMHASVTTYAIGPPSIGYWMSPRYLGQSGSVNGQNGMQNGGQKRNGLKVGLSGRHGCGKAGMPGMVHGGRRKEGGVELPRFGGGPPPFGKRLDPDCNHMVPARE